MTAASKRRVLDVDAFTALRSGLDRCEPPLGVADRCQARPAAQREPERPVDREVESAVHERAHDGELAPAGADPGDPPREVELGLDDLERGLAGRRHEHGVGLGARRPGEGGERMPEPAHGVAAEGHVHLVDPEPVHAGDGASARLASAVISGPMPSPERRATV